LAKTSGLGWTTASIDDASGTPRDIRTDLTSIELSTPRELWEITGVDKSAKERTLLLADFSAKMSGVFDPGVNLAHDVFKTVPSTTVARTSTFGVAGKSLGAKLLYANYPIKRDSSGKLTFDVEGVLADGTVPVWA
jgi:hypothetical protein